MAEVGASVAAKLAEYLVQPTLQQLKYLFCAGKITKNVEIRKEEMMLKQGKVQEHVQEAINRTERIDGEVDKWKNDVKSLIAEVEKLEGELRANNHGCLRGWCPTWSKYCLCKKLAKTIQRMIDLITKTNHFNPFSHPVIVPDIVYHSSQNFKLFNSTQMAFDQLWEALQNDGSSVIGLWGMGGSGKTTLVTEVGKKAKESQLFDRVVIATISQSLDIMQIQDEIADSLGLKLEEKSKTGRAKRIALRLESGERILIILDDVWAKLNLEDIGIPFMGNHPRSWKVVLTTRRLEVCTLMECQKMIKLDLLKEDEAWILFQSHANVNDASKEVMARAIAMECRGLPIALVAMGTCLKGKGVDEMNVMLYRLRNAKPNNVDKGVRDAFACLELSYGYLATPEAKLLLLMCAMFPEDHNIVVEDLFRYGVGLGLCRDVDSFEIARSEVTTIINYLIDSSLLMHYSPKFNTYAEKYVKLHDTVRDFALWKASKENRTITVSCTKEMNELIADEAVKNSYAISSWHDTNKLLEFSSQLDTPRLEFLLLCSREPLDISHVSFEGTKGLKTLIIMCMAYWSGIELQPQSIQHLFNLRTLRLQGWDLHDISFVVSLKRLEILDLRGSKFKRMPNGIEKLNKLKLLDLSNCKTDECCYKVIGRCSQLEELYVSTHSPHSENENCYEYLMAPPGLMKLTRYKLAIGEHSLGLVFQNEDTRSLWLGQLNMSILGATIKDLAQRASSIKFYELEGGSKTLMPNIVQAVGGMYGLTKLSLERCSEIECITSETTFHEDVVVPKLDELVLTLMDNLKELYHGPSPCSFFQKLERLTLSNCPQLLHIFPAKCNLCNLKFLKILNCPMLTYLFPISAACTLSSLEELQIEGCSELKHVIKGEGDGDVWKSSRFPKLKIMSIDDCCKLEYVCPVFLAQRFVQLQHLSIANAPQMKFVFGENGGEEQPMHHQYETQIVLPLLEHLKLESLSNLARICLGSCHPRWTSIKTIEWRDCPNMDFQELEGHQLRNEEYMLLPTIEIPTFQYLKELTLGECARLKFVFSTHIYQSLPELTSVTISCCEELEAIFSGNGETQKNLSITESCLLKLNKLKIFVLLVP
ncbi:probable disease resistance protein At1g61300 [Neltuma alba]|uniref:probable disease resistance protein At1g61300 n=1 Tax=Neltuma alba TaxID=207710 RepID=UPI0010A51A25|nr:probable disease resistance protein At1g61300 [Prosopis alba]